MKIEWWCDVYPNGWKSIRCKFGRWVNHWAVAPHDLFNSTEFAKIINTLTVENSLMIEREVGLTYGR